MTARPDPVAALREAAAWLNLADDTIAAATGTPPPGAGLAQADLLALAGWLAVRPDLAAQAAARLPAAPDGPLTPALRDVAARGA